MLQRFSLLDGLGFESSVARALRHVDLYHAIPETCGQQTGATSEPRQVLTCNTHSLIAWSPCDQWQLRRHRNLLSGSWGIAGVTWRQRAPGGGGAAAPAANARRNRCAQLVDGDSRRAAQAAHKKLDPLVRDVRISRSRTPISIQGGSRSSSPLQCRQKLHANARGGRRLCNASLVMPGTQVPPQGVAHLRSQLRAAHVRAALAQPEAACHRCPGSLRGSMHRLYHLYPCFPHAHCRPRASGQPYTGELVAMLLLTVHYAATG